MLLWEWRDLAVGPLAVQGVHGLKLNRAGIHPGGVLLNRAVEPVDVETAPNLQAAATEPDNVLPVLDDSGI